MTAVADAGTPPAVFASLGTFGSADALRTWIRAQRWHRDANRGGSSDETDGMLALPTPAPTAAAPGIGGMGNAVQAAAAPPPSRHAAGEPGSQVGGAAESITNNQVQGVDEGDIVKTHGDQLVVLRRGRLFTLRLGASAVTPVSMVDAHGPGRPAGGWYDEMLVDGDTIVVIGYSYAAQATEVGLFDISAAGEIHWRDTLYVRSSDYYSSRNYASRLVGHHLVMYMPVPLALRGEEISLAAVRHTPDGAWETVMDYARLYRPVQPVGYSATVHSVMSCDLSGRGFNCHAVGVVGPAGRNFYVSASAVYLWVNGQSDPDAGTPTVPALPPSAVMYRMPLDCGAIGAVRARGAPLDQFSFDERAGALRVMVRSEGAGEGMWASEGTHGDLGLLRVPLGQFAESVPTMGRAAYRGLPSIEGQGESMQNRFVGEHLLYGGGDGWSGPDHSAHGERPVWVYDLARDRSVRLGLTHSVERIEPMDRDALVVGNEPGGLTFSAIALDDAPTVAGRHTVRNASQGETRSHGFFYLPSGDRRGTLGLPITAGGDGGGWDQLDGVSSSVMFLGVDGLNFRELGALRSARTSGIDDHCVASCADWYGNSRPIFWRGRVFALMGYELVEGDLATGRMREQRRVDYLRALLHGAGDHSGNIFNNLPD